MRSGPVEWVVPVPTTVGAIGLLPRVARRFAAGWPLGSPKGSKGASTGGASVPGAWRCKIGASVGAEGVVEEFAMATWMGCDGGGGVG